MTRKPHSHRLMAMDTTIPAGQFKNRCLALLDQVARTGVPLIVTKRGHPVARVVACEAAPALDGSVVHCDDIVSPAIDAGDWDMEREPDGE